MDSNSLIQDLVDLVNNFDPVSLLPDVSTMFGWVETFCRICVLASPVAMLFFGLWYLLLPPKEANRSAGWRFYFGMGSVEAWRFTQMSPATFGSVQAVSLRHCSRWAGSRRSGICMGIPPARMER